MWLPAAKKMKAREAIPRSDEAFVSITPRKDKRWQVYVRLPDGRSATTTCKTQADAKDRAPDFVAAWCRSEDAIGQASCDSYEEVCLCARHP